MTKPKLLAGFLLLAVPFLLSGASTAEPQTSTVPITSVVTVLGPSFGAPPPLGKDDVIVHVNDKVASVSQWNPAQGDRAALHLAILIDDGADVGSRLAELRRFVQTQPNSASVGVFYATNGTTRTAVPFSTDHSLVASKVRITLGAPGTSTSIYLSLIDVIKKLQPVTGRREILLIGDGHDRLRGDLESPDVDRVISSAQKTGVVIHTLYTAVSAGRRNSFGLTLAQSNLTQVAAGSGGQAFFQGLSTPVSYTPFLDQLDMVLHNQYFLTFAVPRSAKKNGAFQSLKIATEQRNVAITAQNRVFVPGP
ncbi:MAG TPA: hypothetical protein VMB02_08280 [Candidatus Aquilonibacter sp.]|nr:hypothetical protein [Candidatus Aquilonibacter sp.]